MTESVPDQARAEVSQGGLEGSVSLLRATLEATADGLLVVDRQGHVTALNQRFVTLWRIPHELTQRRSDSLLIEYVLDQLSDPEHFVAQVRELYANPERESFDVLRFKDGRVFERYSRPQRVGLSIVGRVWSFRDVTERELLLARLSFLADASRLLGSLDVEHALEGVAHSALPYLGDACAVDLLEGGKPHRLLAYSLSAERFDPTPPLAFRGGRSIRFVVDGKAHVAVPMMLKDFVLGVLTFATSKASAYTPDDLEVAEEVGRRAALAIDNGRLLREVQGALRARDEFLSIAAHEIRGPLTSIHLAVQTLLGGDVPKEVETRMLSLLEREDRRLARFVDDLLDLGRIRTGTLALGSEMVNLTDVVKEVVARLSTELERSGSAINLSCDSEVLGRWDRFRIDQLVANLIGNAIKFGLGKPIDISVSSADGHAELVVADQGTGVPAEQRERIFDAFERGVSVQHYGGLGLGLFIVRTIVSRLSGTVRVEGRPGGGSRFVVDLPLGG
jgi:signal transduction histidine kinase